VKVTLNREKRDVAVGTTVADVIRTLDLDGRRIAVEINREILSRDSYAARLLEDGDVIEVVHFVGGG
jgi:sulfur carrier protein